MDKAEFIQRLTDQFRGMIAGAERRAVKEIEGSRGRMDTERFTAWLKEERDAALSEPVLKISDLVMAKTPEAAAQNLAGLIDLDLDGNVNWEDQFKQAAPILVNFHPEKSEGWKYKTYFINYKKAFNAEPRARVFSQRIEQAWPPNTHLAKFGKDEKECLEFRRDVIKRGEAYFVLWDDYKETFLDKDLQEEQFILSDIDLCEEEIEAWKDKSHSFRDAWIGMLKANIRAHRERLEEMRKAKPTKKEIVVSFDDLFLGETEEAKMANIRKAEKAAQKAGLISIENGKTVWKMGERKKRLIVVFLAALLEKQLVFAHIDPYAAGKAIAERFNAGGISSASFYAYWNAARKTFLDSAGSLNDWYKVILTELNRM